MYLFENLAADLCSFHANSIIIIVHLSAEYYIIAPLCILYYYIISRPLDSIIYEAHNAFPRSTSTVFDSVYCAIVVQEGFTCVSLAAETTDGNHVGVPISNALRPDSIGKNVCSTLLLSGDLSISLYDMCVLF